MSDPVGPLPDDVEQAILALEAQAHTRRTRAARTLRYGSVLVSLSFLFLLRVDFLYWIRPAAPADLGGPLEFNLTQEGSHRYVRIAAVPGDQVSSVSYMSHQYRLFGLLSTNILVEQDLGEVELADEPARGQVTHIEGRLDDEGDAEELRHVFERFEETGIISRQDGHLYALRQNERPRAGWSLPLKLLGIVLFLLINLRAAWKVEHPIPLVA